jgi:hypothetical protein
MAEDAVVEARLADLRPISVSLDGEALVLVVSVHNARVAEGILS